MMFIFCLIAVALAEKAVVLGGDEEYTNVGIPGVADFDISNAIYLKYDVNSCIYMDKEETEKFAIEGDKMYHYTYSNDNCGGEGYKKDITDIHMKNH